LTGRAAANVKQDERRRKINRRCIIIAWLIGFLD
jgi:hypothetical protein